MMTLRARTTLALLLAFASLLVPHRAVQSEGGDLVAQPRLDAVSIGVGDRSAATLVVELRLEATTVGRFVPLSELVTVTVDHAQVWDVVGETIVRVREGGLVRRADVERRLARSGLTAAQVRVEGPAFCLCTITPASHDSFDRENPRTPRRARDGESR